MALLNPDALTTDHLKSIIADELPMPGLDGPISDYYRSVLSRIVDEREKTQEVLDDRHMSLVALRDRLSAIIDENERHGRGERNHLPVVFERQAGKTSRSKRRHGVMWVAGGQTSIPAREDGRRYACIVGKLNDEI